jgi:excisionase family DNA binding protein
MTARPRRQHERKPEPATQPGRTSDPAPPGDNIATDRAGQDSPGSLLAYSVDEAARLTGLSRDLLYDEMRRGNLAYVKVGRRRLITRQHLKPVPRHRLLAHSR